MPPPRPGPYQQPPAPPAQQPVPYQQPPGPYQQPPNPPPPDPYQQRPGPYEQAPDAYQEPPGRYDQQSDPYERRPDPYEPSPSRRREDSGRSYQEQRDRREDRANTLANVIHVLTGVIVTVFVLHIVFVLFSANQGSGIVSFVYQVAKVLVLGFGDVFTPGDATIGLVLNYGLAAVVYLVLGRLIAGALRRR